MGDAVGEARALTHVRRKVVAMLLTPLDPAAKIRSVKNSDGESRLGRRRTLQLIGMGSLSAVGLVALSGCKDDKGGKSGGGDKKAAAGGKTCDTAPDAASKQKRKTLQYVEKATDEKKQCKDCVQYIADTYGDCGGCKLFSGPVQPGGGCLSFAPKAAAAPSGSASAG